MKIAVGHSYKTRLGRSTKIIGSFKGLDGKMCFKGDNTSVYDKNGKIDPLRRLPEDLIRLDSSV
jgi:hypothetical protein